MSKISILGAGSFGISLAVIFHKHQNKVLLWGHNKEDVDRLNTDESEINRIVDLNNDNKILVTNNIKLIKDSDIVILAIPSFAIAEVAKLIKDIIKNTAIVVNVSKGFDPKTGKFLLDIIEDCLYNDVVILSGPSHAEELARGVPTTMVACSRNISKAKYIQDKLTNKTLRIYVNEDVIGTQIGSALKNIIALACGICDGLGLGDNSRAALMTRGLAEITRLGCAMGAKRETFFGLTGLGDLIVTCTSVYSRNRQAGLLIGKGISVKDAIDQVGMVVEGYLCSKKAYELAKKYDVDMPVVNTLYYILYQNGDLGEVVGRLMDRPKIHEYERLI